MRKDPDREQVYAAEEAVFESTTYATPMRSDDLLELADCLYQHDWWQMNNIPVPIIEPAKWRDRHSKAIVHVNRTNLDPVIRLRKEDVCPWILAHESAHVAQFHFCRRSIEKLTSHGVEFRDSYLAVTEILFGTNAAARLRSQFNSFPLVPALGVIPLATDKGASRYGLYGRWADEQHSKELRRYLTRTQSMGHLSKRQSTGDPDRINGAIAL